MDYSINVIVDFRDSPCTGVGTSWAVVAVWRGGSPQHLVECEQCCCECTGSFLRQVVSDVAEDAMCPWPVEHSGLCDGTVGSPAWPSHHTDGRHRNGWQAG